MTGIRALHPSSSGRRRFPQLAAGTAAYLGFNRRTRSFTPRQLNIRKFIISLPSTIGLAAGIAVVDGGAAWQAARAQVAWSSVDSSCVVQSAGESLASIDAAHGTVSFKTGELLSASQTNSQNFWCVRGGPGATN